MEAGKLAKPPLIIPSSTRVSDAIDFMSQKKVREVFLVEADKLVGMVTMRSLIGAEVRKEMPVSRFAFMPPVVHPDDDVNKVIHELVDMGLEVLPVMDKLDLIGTISSQEILENTRLSGKVKDIMVEGITIDAKDSIAKARALLMINNINRLPVLDKGRLVGVFTASDIAVRVFLSKYSSMTDGQVTDADLNKPVERYMTKPVISVGPEVKLEDVKTIMLENGFRFIPVTVGERFVGLVCRLDILKKLAPKASGVRIYFTGLEDVQDDLALAIEKHAKEKVKELAGKGAVDRVEITLKRVSESLYNVKIKAGKWKSEIQGDDLLISVKRAFKTILKDAGIE